MKKKVIVIMIFIIIVFNINVMAHGGNITGWNKRDSKEIIEYNGKNYGYHKKENIKHYHQVQWNETKEKWEIIKSAVYYDENFNIINNNENITTKKVFAKYQESVDGDTAKFILNDEIITVRFLGIDTPETVHPTLGIQPYGKEASAFTKEKLKTANKIELEFENNLEKDKYNRYLAWILLDDKLLQEELIEKGFAQTYMLKDSYKYAGILQEKEEKAKENAQGIWKNEKDNTIQNNFVENLVQNNVNEKINKEYKNYIYIFIIFIILLGITIAFKK